MVLIDRYEKVINEDWIYWIYYSLLAILGQGERWRHCRYFYFLFIASHAIGQGAVIWVFLAEIFPNKTERRANRLAAEPIGILRLLHS